VAFLRARGTSSQPLSQSDPSLFTKAMHHLQIAKITCELLKSNVHFGPTLRAPAAGLKPVAGKKVPS
jgi:hypothetical protein